MNDYLRRVGRFYGLIATVPIVIGFVDGWKHGLGFLLAFLAIPILILTLGIGSVIWNIRSYRQAKVVAGLGQRLVIYAAAPILLVATLSLAYPSWLLGRYAGKLSQLMARREHFEAIIAKARIQRKAIWEDIDDGVTYSVDLGPPLRVALNPSGTLGSWSGIIYDPSGEVMRADGIDPKTGKALAPDKITKIFGGDLMFCQHLMGSYYDCLFQ